MLNKRAPFITPSCIFASYCTITFAYFLFKLVIKFLIDNKFVDFLAIKYKAFKIFKLTYY